MNVVKQLHDLHKIAHLRREYTLGALRRQDLPYNPIKLFDKWFKQACEAQLPEPNAMCLATVDKNNHPWQRMVLLKHFDEKGMIFYTNFTSRKAQHLNNNPYISLLFPWNMLERQVIVLGNVERLSHIETVKYFQSRPRDSQISSWVSHQSRVISSRRVLENKFVQIQRKFKKRPIPSPHFWGGFRIYINSIEFWQGGKNRLHDRFFFHRKGKGWKINRLAP
ncbi:MAG: pyridoxamine 5'-phosphate oxidase [Candidatus Dasytiphilus stammeri]